jgi:hypothetical protein
MSWNSSIGEFDLAFFLSSGETRMGLRYGGSLLTQIRTLEGDGQTEHFGPVQTSR